MVVYIFASHYLVVLDNFKEEDGIMGLQNYHIQIRGPILNSLIFSFNNLIFSESTCLICSGIELEVLEIIIAICFCLALYIHIHLFYCVLFKTALKVRYYYLHFTNELQSPDFNLDLSDSKAHILYSKPHSNKSLFSKGNF